MLLDRLVHASWLLMGAAFVFLWVPPLAYVLVVASFAAFVDVGVRLVRGRERIPRAYVPSSGFCNSTTKPLPRRP